MLNIKEKIRKSQLEAVFKDDDKLSVFSKIMEEIIENEPIKKPFLIEHYVDLIKKHSDYSSTDLSKKNYILIYLKYNPRYRFINCGCGGYGKFEKIK